MLHILDLNFLGHTETIAAFLLETDDGPVLFETGPHSTFPQLEKALKEKGYEVSDLQHVFLTHIHLDHAGASWALAKAGATIYVHPFGMKHLHDPSKLMASARRIYEDDMDRLWGDMQPIAEDKLRAVEHGESFDIGGKTIKAWHTPGHAVHHIAWQIGEQLICGDVAGVKIEDGPVVPPCPPPDINIEDWKESIQLIKKLDVDKLWLTHFGLVTHKDTHLNELEARLDRYAQWIKPYIEKKVSPDDITPEFQLMVKEDLQKHGVEGEGLIQYENANPAWMSVAGLLRYWKKAGRK